MTLYYSLCCGYYTVVMIVVVTRTVSRLGVRHGL